VIPVAPVPSDRSDVPSSASLFVAVGLTYGIGSKNCEFSSAHTNTSVIVPTSTSVGLALTRTGFS